MAVVCHCNKIPKHGLHKSLHKSSQDCPSIKGHNHLKKKNLFSTILWFLILFQIKIDCSSNKMQAFNFNYNMLQPWSRRHLHLNVVPAWTHPFRCAGGSKNTQTRREGLGNTASIHVSGTQRAIQYQKRIRNGISRFRKISVWLRYSVYVMLRVKPWIRLCEVVVSNSATPISFYTNLSLLTSLPLSLLWKTIV